VRKKNKQMSNNQQLFKDAIADAKTLREVAVANAKAALEESFMPRIQSMFERRVMEADELEEKKEDELDEKATYVVDKDNLIDSLDENEEMEEDLDLEELFNSLSEDEDMEEGYGAREYEMGKKAGETMMEEDDLEEDYDLEEILRELEEEDSSIYEDYDEDSMEEGTDEDLNENSMFEKASGGESIDEVTVDELRDMIQDAIRAVMGGEAGAAGDEEMDMDMTDMDMGGAEGDDEFNLDIEDETEETEEKPKKKKSKEEELDELFALYERKKKEKEELDERAKYKGGKKEKELDEAYDKKANAPFGLGKSKNKIGAPYGASGDKKSGLNGAYKNKLSMKLNEKVKEVDEAKKKEEELEEAINVIKSLRGQLNEVNLLNAKLIYVNKLFKASNLTENQKVNVVNSFDKAQTLTEAKNIYEVLKNTTKSSKVSSKTTLKEHKSFASSIVGGTTAKSPIISTDDQITRMQQLAGIITK
jgi:hypothetical protein